MCFTFNFFDIKTQIQTTNTVVELAHNDKMLTVKKKQQQIEKQYIKIYWTLYELRKKYMLTSF